ncbi:MAG: hypothetical protein U9Q31_01220, partial [Chloroflexota bacterium]|nr:hypothetical protein [Chloroflexota bacterium]
VAMVVGLGLATMAGPLLGLQLVPTAGTAVGFEAGWAFSDSNIVIQKTDLSSVYGYFSLAAIWTPTSDGFKYRGGVAMDWYLSATGLDLWYNGLTFIVGAQKTWRPFTAYGDIRMSSTGVLTPVVGINVLFDLFGPSPGQPLME